MPSASGKPTGAAAALQGHDLPPAAALLCLPDFLLLSILDRLTLAADLAAAAAACSALKYLVAHTQWKHICSYSARCGWSPALPGSLRWAAGHCPQLRDLDLSGATACCDDDLLPLRQLSSLTRLSLEGLWRVTGASSSGSGSGSSGRRRNSNSGGPGGGPGQQTLDVLAAVVGSNRGLLGLDLSGTAVPVGASLGSVLGQLVAGAPNATKPAHGLHTLRLAGCGRPAGGGNGGGGVHQQGQQHLGRVLLECPALTWLDVSGCRWLTAEALPGVDVGDTLGAALGGLPLRHASFAGCELLGGIGWLLGSWEQLETLDLSGTGVDDADVAQLSAGCPRLRSLNLSACCRIKGASFAALQQSAAVLCGHLSQLRLADLAWITPQHLGPLLHSLSRSADGPLHLDLSSCGGLDDAALLSLLDSSEEEEPGQQGVDGHRPGGNNSSSNAVIDNSNQLASRGGVCRRGCGIRDLRLGGSSRLTAGVLQQLAEARVYCSRSGTRGGVPPDTPSATSILCDSPAGGEMKLLLSGLQQLDVGHVQCLANKGSSTAHAPGSAAGNAAVQALAAVLRAAGSSLLGVTLDGCFLGAGLLPLLAQSCPAVERLSLVGCTGVGDADMAVVSTLRSLADLAVGGASLAWHEHRALAGLTGLTRLRIARRPFLTDGQLAPLLAANRGTLVRLELAGCASLSDAVLLHLLPPPPGLAQDEGHAEVQAEGAGKAAQQQHDSEGHWQQARRETPAQQQDPQAPSECVGQQERQHLEAGDQRQAVQQQQSHQPKASVQLCNQHQRQAAQPAQPPLRHLQLVCCDRMVGGSLRQLAHLRSLRLPGCPTVSQGAVQAAAICLTRLTLLELPNHVPVSSIPVSPGGAASHLRGLMLLGGLEERGGGGRRGGSGRRRSGG